MTGRRLWYRVLGPLNAVNTCRFAYAPSFKLSVDINDVERPISRYAKAISNTSKRKIRSLLLYDWKCSNLPLYGASAALRMSRLLHQASSLLFRQNAFRMTPGTA